MWHAAGGRGRWGGTSRRDAGDAACFGGACGLGHCEAGARRRILPAFGRRGDAGAPSSRIARPGPGARSVRGPERLPRRRGQACRSPCRAWPPGQAVRPAWPLRTRRCGLVLRCNRPDRSRPGGTGQRTHRRGDGPLCPGRSNLRTLHARARPMRTGAIAPPGPIPGRRRSLRRARASTAGRAPPAAATVNLQGMPPRA